uniref:Uncharacterized protein n=1 Tax=Cyanoderma ruficeps TaxID=181631 RepID=A0A8C3QY10_9PASS
VPDEDSLSKPGTYPPLSVGVRPNRVQSPTDISRELSTVTTAASARPHLDFTMSIFPGKQPRPRQQGQQWDQPQQGRDPQPRPRQQGQQWDQPQQGQDPHPDWPQGATRHPPAQKGRVCTAPV